VSPGDLDVGPCTPRAPAGRKLSIIQISCQPAPRNLIRASLVSSAQAAFDEIELDEALAILTERL